MKKRLMVLIMFALSSMIPFSLYADTIGSARISLMEGDVLVQTQDTGTEWMAASVNVPLLSGDRIWVPENGRSEIQFLGGSYIRADKNTGLDITKLNRDSEDYITQVGVTQGRTYVHQTGSAARNSVFQVDTPLVSATAYGSAIFDVYVFADGYTEVSVIKGTVSVEGQHGNTKVDAGHMISVSTENCARLSPRRANDGWLSWNVSRDSLIAGTGSSIKYLPSTLYDYTADFDQYGYWVHTPDYGYVWSPRIAVTTWAPYRNGRWIWRNHDYVWVSYEPWGWAPYHYGRWAFTIGIGWFWVPPAADDVFWGPGFVAWINTPTYVSWVPLAPREIYYGHGHYGRHSINVTKINIKNTHVTNVYVNTKVAHAVSVVHHDTFVRGRHINVRNALANPFLAGLRVSTGRPSIKQINHSPLPLKVVQRKYLPAKAVPDNKGARELSRRNTAMNKTISAFRGTKPITPVRVSVIKDKKSISSNQRLHRVQPQAIPQVSNQAQRQESRSTTQSGTTVRRVEPRAAPQVKQPKHQQQRITAPQISRQVQIKEPRATTSGSLVRRVASQTASQVNKQVQQRKEQAKNTFAQNSSQPRSQNPKSVSSLEKNRKHEQRKEKK